VPDTVARVAGLGIDVRLIHLNHTNALWDDQVAIAELEPAGVRVGRRGDSWRLDASD
jgi:hypothetical protein